MASPARDLAAHATRMARRRTVPGALVDVCRGETPQLPADDTTRQMFLDGVRRHRIAPLAHVALRDAEPELAAGLKGERDAAVSRHISSTVVLDGLREVLGDLPWAVFKGPALSELAHPVPGLRTYHDLDVLISPSQLRLATARLADAGWQLTDYADMLRNPDVPGEMHWVSPTGMLVDLHWSVINMASTRRLFTVSTDEILERRISVPIGVTSAWTLDPVDSTVHVCLHAALTGAHRMLLLLDADQLARKVPAWGDVTTRALEWKAGPALAIVLSRARALLGTPVPDELNRDLDLSTGFRVVTGTVDRFMPVSTLRRDASLPRLVARSARAEGNATLAAVGRRGLRGLTDRLTVQRPGDRADGRHPATSDDVDAFVRAVEAHAARTA